ncbi:PREDICTED: odorant receptor 4-like [Ceratosolen solmsi marchali]|uniref:Odorant receptor 4-like n=1 Tax=Ceratosolen solmsi marchali TaxID=326594 RepID=A0AAJ6VK57_9HYME|nr:PREDICTED: odorant receptor 4-like [Ceratosolen solmsi marchali]
MDILPDHFRMLRYLGLWYQADESFWIIKEIYSIVTIIMIFSFICLQVAATSVLANGNLKIFIETLSIVLTYISFFFKMINFKIQRKNMNKLLDSFRMEICQPKTPQENNIILDPVDLTNPTVYALVYFYEVLMNIISVLLHIVLDSMGVSFICLISGQLELCCYRIVTWSENVEKFSRKKSIKYIVMHHNLIKDIFQRTENFFMIIIIPFFSICLLVICLVLFQLVQKNVSFSEHGVLALYFFTLINEVFLFCWFGNQLTVKSEKILNAVYKSNWLELTTKDRKSYYFAMLMGAKGLTMSYHGLCQLSVKTYAWIIKMTYTVFNLLQRVQINN